MTKQQNSFYILLTLLSTNTYYRLFYCHVTKVDGYFDRSFHTYKESSSFFEIKRENICSRLYNVCLTYAEKWEKLPLVKKSGHQFCCLRPPHTCVIQSLFEIRINGSHESTYLTQKDEKSRLQSQIWTPYSHPGVAKPSWLP